MKMKTTRALHTMMGVVRLGRMKTWTPMGCMVECYMIWSFLRRSMKMKSSRESQTYPGVRSFPTIHAPTSSPPFEETVEKAIGTLLA
jgi:hypothetical protein